MMWGQPFFKKNMSWLMPDKRPTDNMELAVDLPQEEEFALANMMPYTYYNFGSCRNINRNMLTNICCLTISRMRS